MVLECTFYEKKDSLAWITLNRPQVLNALNKRLWREIYENLDQAEKDEEIRAIIITGAGRAFSAGDDIKEVASLETLDGVKTFFLDFAAPTITKIVELPKPIIAAVNGLAYGRGCEIAMLCDLVVASENATFAIPEALIGAIPPIAAAIGAHIIGKLNVSMLMLTGEPIAAQEAKSMGLVNKVVPAQELLKAAEELAKSTTRAAPSSIRAIKKLMGKQLELERLMQTVEELMNIVQTDEGKESHRAFMEKRAPQWVKT
ncbi:MAG: enoyl-CoA hydratase/isomerase family protein [Candidatus Bathyarchaeia archaeon]|nr:enoyl-CoA hydratase/isomerase family protein [Candidatus Bathyarchaeia archaeon]